MSTENTPPKPTIEERAAAYVGDIGKAAAILQAEADGWSVEFAAAITLADEKERADRLAALDARINERFSLRPHWMAAVREFVESHERKRR